MSLPCGHKICKQCLDMKKNSKNANDLTCPRNQEHKFTKGQQFRVDYDVLEYLKNIDFINIKCNNHQDNLVDQYCIQTNNFICKDCTQSCKQCRNQPSNHIKLENFKIQFNLLEKRYWQTNRMIIETQVQLHKVVILRAILLDKQQQKEQVKEASQLKSQREKFHLLLSNILKADTLEEMTDLILLDQQQREQQGLFDEFRQLVNLQMNKETSFIFRKQFDNPKTKLSFNQIYVGTRDGFKATDFHSRCDNKGLTVCFILSETGNVFGGFVTKSWGNYAFKEKDDQAFIFSLTNQSIHIQKNHLNSAIRNDPQKSWNQGEYDISINDKCNEVDNTLWLGWTYQDYNECDYTGSQAKNDLKSKINFKVLDLEVYQVLNWIN
ncbi:UNKNOWN [Stylonychia lemnae]|uniref:TLDc domain-containing protein n=1 Tax=Stylonychia lemnae TaxID=5949 RepID=A0A078B718_STYLE|nr:UNKNOWN [Stylonychia lemnae]|eukprot:CDW89986.1 UNKNOWN [Stylonychia lemnae]